MCVCVFVCADSCLRLSLSAAMRGEEGGGGKDQRPINQPAFLRTTYYYLLLPFSSRISHKKSSYPLYWLAEEKAEPFSLFILATSRLIKSDFFPPTAPPSLRVLPRCVWALPATKKRPTRACQSEQKPFLRIVVV